MNKIRIFIAGPEKDTESKNYKESIFCKWVESAAESNVEVITSKDCLNDDQQNQIDEKIKKSDLLFVLSDKDGKFGDRTLGEVRSFYWRTVENTSIAFFQRVVDEEHLTKNEIESRDKIKKEFDYYVTELPRMNISKAELNARNRVRKSINKIILDRKRNRKRIIIGLVFFLLIASYISIDSYRNMKTNYLYLIDSIYSDNATLTDYPGLKDASKWDSIFRDWKKKMENDPLLDTNFYDILYKDRSFKIPKAWIDERRFMNEKKSEKYEKKLTKKDGTEYIVTDKYNKLYLSKPSGIEFINLSDSI